MSGLIYKRVRSHQWTDEWEQLTPPEQAAVLKKLDEILKLSSGKRYVLLAYDAAQALEEWDTFGIEIFPHIQALQQHEELLNQIEFSKFVQIDAATGGELASLGLALCVKG